MQDKNKSLLSLFIPPKETLRGTFGLLSGYSATQDFMEMALDNFTSRSSLERGTRGGLNMALFLDKRKVQIQVQGLYHALFSSHKSGFSLMHAKVGCLAFARSEHSPIEILRIFISTGNWTRSGMLENLDHVWKLDIDLKSANSADLVEVRKVLEFFKRLTDFYPIIDAVRTKIGEIEKLVPNNFSADDFKNARFFSTFEDNSMLNEIQIRINKPDNKGYNTIFCGSGFFEDVDDGENLRVFNELETKLIKGSAFTRNPDRLVIINQIDKWKFKSLAARDKDCWSVHPFEDYKLKENQRRFFLHSKFIFCGYYHNGNYTRGSMYLGSGNLTKKGLLYNIKNPEGNIEAGVVISLTSEGKQLCQNLCIGAKEYKLDELVKAEIKSSMEEIGDEIIFASPLLAIVDFDLEKRTGNLYWSDDAQDCFFYGSNQSEIYHIAKTDVKIKIPLSCDVEGSLTIFTMDHERPYSVPIITKDGEFCLIPPKKLDANTVLDMLLEFPDSHSTSEIDEDGEIIKKNKNIPNIVQANEKSSSRSLSIAMEIVECIARKNHTTPPELLMGWFCNLEFTLIKCLEDREKEDFRKLGINFLNVLKNEHFAPNWNAIDGSEVFRAKYEGILEKICNSWGISAHPPLAGTNT